MIDPPFYDDEFRWKWCRFCENKKTTINGNFCGLQRLPYLSKDHCIEYREDENYIHQLELLDEETHRQNEEKRFINYWQIFAVLVIPISMLITIYFKSQLDADYRWALATPTEVKVKYGFRLPPNKTFLYYEYEVDSQNYEGRHELEVKDQKLDVLAGFYFIRFNPTNPSNSMLPKLTKAEPFVQPSDVPLGGVHPDSLGVFLAKLRYRARQKNNTTTPSKPNPELQK